MRETRRALAKLYWLMLFVSMACYFIFENLYAAFLFTGMALGFGAAADVIRMDIAREKARSQPQP